MRPSIPSRILALLVAITGPVSFARPTFAQGDATPPRLGFVDGDVSFWRPGAADRTAAQVNTALAAGDSLYSAAPREPQAQHSQQPQHAQQSQHPQNAQHPQHDDKQGEAAR